MSPRLRILTFGSAAALVIAGGVSAAFVGGVTGEFLTIVLMSVGLAGAVLLVFLEIGLSEDREYAREEKRRKRDRKVPGARRRPPPPRRPRRPG